MADRVELVQCDDSPASLDKAPQVQTTGKALDKERQDAMAFLSAGYSHVLRILDRRAELVCKLENEVGGLVAENLLLQRRLSESLAGMSYEAPEQFEKSAGTGDTLAAGHRPPLKEESYTVSDPPLFTSVMPASLQQLVVPKAPLSEAPPLPGSWRIDETSAAITGAVHEGLWCSTIIKSPAAKPEESTTSDNMALLPAKGEDNEQHGDGEEHFELVAIWHENWRKPLKMPGNCRIANMQPAMTAVDQDAGEELFQTHEEHGTCRHLVIHPYAVTRSLWDLSSLVLVFYDMIMIPMGFFELSNGLFLKMMSWVTRLFWSLDMPMSFLSGYVADDGSIELRSSRILRKYLRSWFFLDCVVVGVDWVEVILSSIGGALGFARMSKATRVFRILRMVRLLRLARMNEIFELLTERLNNEKLVIIMDIMKLMMIMAACGHMFACLFYAVGNTGSEDDWVSVFGYDDKDIPHRYVMAFRWSVSQFSGGMDEVTPQSFFEHIFAVLVGMFSYWSGAVFLGILTSSMTQLYLLGSQQATQLTILRRYLNSHGISKKLAMRVQRNAQHAMTEKEKTAPEVATDLLTLVSEPLRKELHFEMYAPLMGHHPFFKTYIQEMPDAMRKVCHAAMSVERVSCGDIVFSIGEMDHVPKMYFVKKGILMYTGIHQKSCTVQEGAWVSEANLWVNWTHRGRLHSSQDGQLYILDAKSFQEIVIRFEHLTFEPRSYGQNFVDGLNKMRDVGEEISDLTSIEYIPLSERVRATRVSRPRQHRRSYDSVADGENTRMQMRKGQRSAGPPEAVDSDAVAEVEIFQGFQEDQVFRDQDPALLPVFPVVRTETVGHSDQQLPGAVVI